MKKIISYLKFLVNIFFALIIGSFIFRIIEIIKWILFEISFMTESSILVRNTLFENIIYLLGIVLLGYLLYLTNRFRNMLYNSHISSFFSEKNTKISQGLGKGLIYYSVLKFILEVISKSIDGVSRNIPFAEKLGETMVNALFERIPLLFIALFILIIAQFIKEGYVLKNENDLTI
jgi:hypothetical protein